jgi:hypothetical protein
MRAWRHLLFLTVLSVGAVFLIDLLSGAPTRAGGWSGAPGAALRALPDILAPTLAVALAIAVGTLPPTAGHTKRAALMTAVVLLLLVSLDFALPASHALPTIVGAFSGSLGDTGEIVTAYDTSHPRRVLLEALQRGGLLLSPVVLAGISLGVAAWIHSRVMFRSPRDGTVARWVVSWALAPGVLAFVLNWAQSAATDVLFRGSPIWHVLVPWTPAMMLAVVGWRAAARSTQSEPPVVTPD